MPQRGRSKRVASRQAELGQKKKRQARPQTETPLDTTPRVDEAQEADQGTTAALEPARPTPTPRSFLGRQPAPTPSVYNYINAEMKRIGILSTAILAALIVFTFVLR